MVDNRSVQQPDTEKITINLGHVDLGQIDLLVRDRFYSNRTDFIRTAIRNQLTNHGEAVRGSILRNELELGYRRFSRAELLAAQERGVRLRIRVLGLAVVDGDITAELALDTIESITVLGALHISRDLRSALSDRIL